MTITARFASKFPSRVIGLSGIAVTKTAGTYYIGPDYGSLPEGDWNDPENKSFPVWNSQTGQHERITAQELFTVADDAEAARDAAEQYRDQAAVFASLVSPYTYDVIPIRLVGEVEDAASIRRAIAIADDLPGVKRVFCPAGRGIGPNGEYILGDPTGTTNEESSISGAEGFINPASGVWLCGQGDGTIFKVADGMNTADRNFAVIMPFANDIAYRVDNFRVSDIQFDMNGANNGGFFYTNHTITIFHGNGIVIENIRIINHPGSQCISLGLNETVPTVNKVLIRGVRVHNVGDTVNASVTDHSSIYIIATQWSIENCHFTNDTQSEFSTAMEVHGAMGGVANCSHFHYRHAFNVVAIVTNIDGLTISDTKANSCYIGMMVYCQDGFLMRGVGINNFKGLATDCSKTAFFDTQSHNEDTGTVYDITFTNCTVTNSNPANTAHEGTGLLIGRVKAIISMGNIWRNISGRGISLGGSDAGYTSITIVGDQFHDFGLTANTDQKQGVALNDSVPAATVIVTNCTFTNSLLNTTKGIIANVAVPSGGGIIKNNVFSGVTTPTDITGTNIVTT